jgi:hypothetical protein
MLTLTFIGTVVFIVHELVSDKQSSLLETFKIMSLSKPAYIFSFMISQGTFTFLSAFIASTGFLLASSNAYKTNGDPSTLYLAMILFGIS